MKLLYSYIKGAICLSNAITWSDGKNQNRISNKNNITARAAVRSLMYSLLLTVYSLFTFSLSAQEPRKDSGADGPMDFYVQGTVVSEADGKPLQGVSVRVEAENLRISTKKDGSFSLRVLHRKGKVKFTSVGFTTLETEYVSGVSLQIRLAPAQGQLDEVEVVSTGYQKIPKERATGSFEFVDNKLFNRKVSTDFVSRLEDVVPSISSTKIFSDNNGNLLNINVRGVSTLQSERWPLVVIDGVPYENRFADYGRGAFNNINPNDIENITVLKDAAAASIWGAQSGNGVIVITTKRGSFNENVNFAFNTNISIRDKPNLYYYPQMSTSDYIELQRYLFGQGRYNSILTGWQSNVQPTIQLMKQQRDGLISEDQLDAALDQLKKIDIRDDFTKYVYRNAFNQQHNVQLKAGGQKVNTLFSVGYDRNLGELVTSSLNRLTLKSVSQIRPVKRLLLDIGVTYTESNTTDSYDEVAYNRMGGGESNYPYMQLADENGDPLPVELFQKNPVYRDTIAGGRLLDWAYRPLKELYDSKLVQKTKDFFFNMSANYSFDSGFRLSGLYSYQRNINPISQWRGIGSFYLRDEINYYANWTADEVIWNLPVGDYMLINHWESYAHQGRLNLEYNRRWNQRNELVFLGGYDIRALDKENTVSQYYGYDPETGAFTSVKYGMEVSVLNGKAGVNNLIDRNLYSHYRNRFVSYYANAAYTYDDRYTLSGSFRKDASNLFGVKSNDRGQPFWSIGGAWLLSKEPIFQKSTFNLLKLRATYGYNGNVNNTVAAYPIMSIQDQPHYITGENYAMMSTPPNLKLRWERVGNLNLGVDFALLSHRLSGSIEYYRKQPKDLIAAAPVDPSTGFSTLTINSANLDTRGWDISVHAVPVRTESIEWGSHLIFSYSRTKVSKSYVADDIASNFISGAGARLMTPVEGLDLYSQLTYKWAGLDPETGEPRAYLNGEISRDYIAIVSSPVSALENRGSLVPLYFGAFRNNLRFRRLELSMNISYQLGHVFMRSSFSNANFLGSAVGHQDYAQRWQKPGDEVHTDVPAFTYPNNTYASQVYLGSSALVENAGQVKLRDIQLSYSFPDGMLGTFRSFRIYAYIQNVGTIWRANKKGIDPEYGRNIPEPLMSSLGFNFNF